MEERYCENCRAELPAKADACPACGTFAGDVFDGRFPEDRRRTRRLIVLVVTLLALSAAAFFLWPYAMPFVQRYLDPQASEDRAAPPSTRVVKDRPGGARRGAGAKVTEAEALRILRSHLVQTTDVKADCIALMSHGYARGAYAITAVDSCAGVRLGKWQVDGTSGRVGR
jgi:hypothetical protein